MPQRQTDGCPMLIDTHTHGLRAYELEQVAKIDQEYLFYWCTYFPYMIFLSKKEYKLQLYLKSCNLHSTALIK